MSDVDLSKIKPGDEITVRVRAFEPRNGGWAVRALPNPTQTFIRAEDIISHVPKTLQVGDRAQPKRGEWRSGDPGTIVAIDGGDAWLKRESDHSTYRLDDLERLDA